MLKQGKIRVEYKTTRELKEEHKMDNDNRSYLIAAILNISLAGVR